MTNLSTATAFWEKWNLSLPDLKHLKNWKPPFSDPSDIIIMFSLSFISLLFACYLFRVITAGHWSEYRGVWAPMTVMILLFLIGFNGLAIIVTWIH